MLYCDLHWMRGQVRTRQIAMKERKAAMEKEREAAHHEVLVRQMAEYDVKEIDARRKAEEKIRTVRGLWLGDASLGVV